MMHGPDGTNWPNTTVFQQVETYSKLVYDHGGNDDQPPMFRVTVLFSELPDKKTKIKMTMTLPSEAAVKKTRKFIKKAGGNSTWDRLAEFLAEKDTFVINETFKAPIDLMFDMWTNPKHVRNWMPPTGFTMKYISAQVKPGGTSFYSVGNESFTKDGKAHYLEIVKASLIKHTQVFCDSDGKISRHPMAPTWPETMLTAVTFYEEVPGETRVTITW